ncbi:helix-turn-helix domain-containing protein [Phenylobacterium sp. LjRoot219]|uniref:IclR family transcriptional regulator n=1 Tax=Phenylobacterium sp. LjRoot219 TaxID=3342283 RepID=UPI003ECDFEE1
MTQLSPGVHRVAAILNVMADHPDQAFTVSDLVRALKMSRATCHALLCSLVEEGFLYRSNDKTYVLGPQIAHIGQIAAQHASPLQIAQSEMRALANEFEVICSAIFQDDDVVVVRERAASMHHLGWSTPKDVRMKLRPPFGGVFYAWSPMTEVERWLDTLTPPPKPELKATMLESMEFARAHGFTFAVRNSRYTAPHWAPDQLFGGESQEYPVSQVTALVPDEEYALISLLAPVFDAKRRVAFILGLNGFTYTTSGAEVGRIGQRLREACDRITAYTTGRSARA